MNYLSRHPGAVAALVVQHSTIAAAALGIALLCELPLGVLIARRPLLRGPFLALLGAIYTIPSLALFALLIPVFGLGFWTAVIALAAYAQMILVRNVVAGLGAVDAAATEAARGMGMTSWQVFSRVEAPLALPSLIGGTRIAAASIIGIATIAAWINAGGLGVLLFAGIYQDNSDKIVAGALACALLALAADGVFRAIERTVTPWRG